MRALLALALLLAIDAGSARPSQPVGAPGPSKADTAHTDAKASEPQPLASAPESALAPPKPTNAQERARARKDGSGKAGTDSRPWTDYWAEKFREDPIVLFTLVLSLSTIALWLDTKGLRRATKTAADAAKASAELALKEFNATHRPRIRFRHVKLREWIRVDTPVHLKVEVVNIGDTGATIIEINAVSHFVAPDRHLPPEPFENSQTAKFPNQKLPEGRTYIVDFLQPAAVNMDKIKQMRAGVRLLYCLAYVDYIDASIPPRSMRVGCVRVFRVTPSKSGDVDTYHLVRGSFARPTLAESGHEYEYEE